MNIEAFLAAQLARPLTHRVLITYAGGKTRHLDVRSIEAAENHAASESRKIGRNLIDRVTGEEVRVIAVKVIPLDRAVILSRKITTLEEAKAFIDGLVAVDAMFHFDDSPETIFGPTGRLFTDEEAALVRQRLDEVYGFDFGQHGCPIGYSLDVTEPGWRTH